MIDDDKIMAHLSAYLEEANDQPTVWGKSDCTAWARRWVESIRGEVIPLPVWRSKKQAMRYIAEAGSLANLWAEWLDAYGLQERYEPPQPGDVGIIIAHSFPQVGGIFLSHGLFAWRAEPHGARVLLPKPQTIVKVWALQ